MQRIAVDFHPPSVPSQLLFIVDGRCLSFVVGGVVRRAVPAHSYVVEITVVVVVAAMWPVTVRVVPVAGGGMHVPSTAPKFALRWLAAESVIRVFPWPRRTAVAISVTPSPVIILNTRHRTTTKKQQSFINFALSSSSYNSSCIFVFSLWTVIVTICTYALLCTYGLCYFAFTDCDIIIVVALFALHCYSAIRLSS